MLYRLFGEGLISALKYDLDKEKESVEFIPTRDEIRSAFHSEEDVYYRLTQAGGRIWEARSHPNWHMYVAESYGTEDGEIISMDLNLVEKAFGIYVQNCQNSTLIENQVWDVLSPWEATYWKTLPLGNRVRFNETRFSDEEVESRQEQQTPEEFRQLFAEERQWWQERDSWYTRPW